MGEGGQHHATMTAASALSSAEATMAPFPLVMSHGTSGMKAPSPKVKKEDNADCTGEPR